MMQISLFKLTKPALNENRIISLEINISYEFFPFTANRNENAQKDSIQKNPSLRVSRLWNIVYKSKLAWFFLRGGGGYTVNVILNLNAISRSCFVAFSLTNDLCGGRMFCAV